MDDWLDRFADGLGEDRVSPQEMGALLKMSREVAHQVERKYAPLSTFLTGVYVGRRLASGEPRDQALQHALAEALARLPDRAESADEAGGA